MHKNLCSKYTDFLLFLCFLTHRQCFISENWPDVYANSKACRITVKFDGMLKVLDFHTEDRGCSDPVTVHGNKYCGSDGSLNGGSTTFLDKLAVKKDDTIYWKSDSGTNFDGFKICFVPDDCTKSSGSAENAADCTCNTVICSKTNGKFCNAAVSTCAKIPIPNCAKTNGAVANSASCACASKVCESAELTGMFCNTKSDDATKCTKYPSCSKIQGSSGVNSGRCFCGNMECVDAGSTGLFCHGNEGVCSKIDTICGANEHVVSKKCVPCATGHNKAGDDPEGADTVCDVFVPRTRIELQTALGGCIGACSFSDSGDPTSYCRVTGGDSTQEDRMSLHNNEPWATGTGDPCLNANAAVPTGKVTFIYIFFLI